MQRKKQDWEYPRENVRLRLFLRGKEEVWEICSDYEGRTLLENKAVLPLGESAANFLYGDFEDVYKDMRLTEITFAGLNYSAEGAEGKWRGLFSLAEDATRRHPFFFFVKQEIYRIYQNYLAGEKIKESAVSALIAEYERVRGEFAALIGGCLNADGDKKTPKFQRYIADINENKFNITNNLSYGKTSAQFDDHKEILVLQNAGKPFQILPPLERLATGNRPLGLFEVLEPESLFDVLRFLLAQYLKTDVSFRICKSCNRFFAVTGASRAEYCNRPYNGVSGKTCKQMGAIRLYESKKNESPVNRAYSKAYKTHNARIRYGSMTREEFSAWSIEARKKRELCQTGKLDLADFEEWLND